MNIFIGLSSGTDALYRKLVELDSEIRSSQHDSIEWTPAMIFANDDALAPKIAERKALQEQLGLGGASGPFYDDYYLHGDAKVFID